MDPKRKEKIVNFQQLFSKPILALGLLALVFSFSAIAQRVQPTPSVIIPVDNRPVKIARGNNLYCAGYIQQGAMTSDNRIIGSTDEADKYNYDQNDFMYINMGSNKGVKVGDTLAVIRPRGPVRSHWTNKSDIGFYVQEIGALEVVNVKPEVSVARIRTSCDAFQLGDMVQATERRESPLVTKHASLDLFSEPSGKAKGRIVLARDHAEMLTRDFIAYVDIGLDENVRVGDTMTVFRPLGKGNLMGYPQKEAVSWEDYGFESDVYRGGRFSNQSGSKSGDRATGPKLTTYRAKLGRPELRQVLGEAVVLNVKERTATVVITRTAREIHTGDYVELQ
jgi:hypothetical protein